MPSWRTLRSQVYERDKGICRDCGVALKGRWDCAHKTPRYQGGKDTLDNLKAKCPSCHLSETKAEAGHRSAGKKTTVATLHGQVVPRKKKRKWPSRKLPKRSDEWVRKIQERIEHGP